MEILTPGKLRRWYDEKSRTNQIERTGPCSVAFVLRTRSSTNNIPIRYDPRYGNDLHRRSGGHSCGIGKVADQLECLRMAWPME